MEFVSANAIIVRMRGLPYDCTDAQIRTFFEPLKLTDKILFITRTDGRPTGNFRRYCSQGWPIRDSLWACLLVTGSYPMWIHDSWFVYLPVTCRHAQNGLRIDRKLRKSSPCILFHWSTGQYSKEIYKRFQATHLFNSKPKRMPNRVFWSIAKSSDNATLSSSRARRPKFNKLWKDAIWLIALQQ